MAVFAETEQSEVEQRSVSVQRVGAVKAFEHGLVVGCAGRGRYSLCCDRMNVVRGDWRVPQQRLPRHVEIAARIIVGNDALVAPEPMRAIPGKA